MATSKVKDGMQKLSFLKSYSSLIVPIVISLVGVLLFIPTQLMSGKLKEQITSKSITPAERIDSLVEEVPSRDQWKEEQKYQQSYKEDAERISQIAPQSSQRDLLSYKVFPKPQDSSISIFLDFGERFRSSIEKMLSALGASDCPTEAELKMRTSSTPMSLLSDVDSEIKDILCEDRARTTPFYVNPSDLSGYNFWEEYEYPGIEESVKDCWHWQLGYWIIEDVVDTVSALNQGSESVFTSAVKRIVYVRFSMEESVVVGRFARSRNQEAQPKYVSSLLGSLTLPYTGRYSNDEIDVVHFNISVVVANKAIPLFPQELCSAKEHKFKGFSSMEPERTFKHNQITILESATNPVAPDDPEHELYRYGDDAVVKLDLICEYIFDKQGYEAIKPDSLKKTAEGSEETTTR